MTAVMYTPKSKIHVDGLWRNAFTVALGCAHKRDLLHDVLIFTNKITSKFSNQLNFLGKKLSGEIPKRQKNKKFTITALQKSQLAVRLNRYLNLCFCTQGLKNSVKTGHYYTVSNGHKVGVCALTSSLTKGLSFYGRVGAEYNSLKANHARRLSLHGSLTSRSPFNLGEVLL